MENLLVDLDGQLNTLIDHVDTEFRDDLFSEVDAAGFKKDSTAFINSKVSEVKTATKDDVNSVKGEFAVESDAAGPTLPSDFDLASVFADGTNEISIIVTSVSDTSNTATVSLVKEVDQSNDCDFGPSDDLKYRYLCTVAGVFEYGNESYTCVDSNLPTSLFCAA